MQLTVEPGVIVPRLKRVLFYALKVLCFYSTILSVSAWKSTDYPRSGRGLSARTLNSAHDRYLPNSWRVYMQIHQSREGYFSNSLDCYLKQQFEQSNVMICILVRSPYYISGHLVPGHPVIVHYLWTPTSSPPD